MHLMSIPEQLVVPNIQTKETSNNSKRDHHGNRCAKPLEIARISRL